jgi:tetratricopeptide (TPR) repeat protein
LRSEKRRSVPEHPDVAASLNNLAQLYKAQGRYADAEPLFKRSLAISEKTLGPDHPNVAASLNNLAQLYKAQGRYAEAEPLYERSLAISEKALGPDNPKVAISLNDLAGLYDAQGRYDDALPIVRQMFERGFFSSDPAFLVLMGSQKAVLIDEAASFNDSYKVLQASSSSAVR